MNEPILQLEHVSYTYPESDRPGMRALRELGVRSPLRECGVTKADVRRLSAAAGLFTAWHIGRQAGIQHAVTRSEIWLAEYVER